MIRTLKAWVDQGADWFEEELPDWYWNSDFLLGDAQDVERQG